MSGKKDHPWPPRYFEREGDRILPNGLARSPWDRSAVAGGPLGGLLACGAEMPEPDDGFEIARFNVDILGRVPHAPIEMRSEPVHRGRQTRLDRICLIVDEQVRAQAHVLRVRRAEAPVVAAPADYPAIEATPEGPWLDRVTMAGAMRSRPVSGKAGEPGRGIGWLRFDGQIIGGETPSPFVKAAYFADFGSGVGSATRTDEWSYANLDIVIDFLRMPVGEWYLIDAQTHMAGNGRGVAMSAFADEQGIYARGLQTVFVAPARSA